MRLIDAEALFVDASFFNDELDRAERFYSEEQIKNAPTVDAVKATMPWTNPDGTETMLDEVSYEIGYSQGQKNTKRQGCKGCKHYLVKTSSISKDSHKIAYGEWLEQVVAKYQECLKRYYARHFDTADTPQTEEKEQKMRLIDADALLEKIDTEREILVKDGRLGTEHILVHYVREFIEDAPTANPYGLVLEGLRQVPMFTGRYDAKHGNVNFMFGVLGVLEYIADKAGDEEYDGMFLDNMNKSVYGDKAE